MSVSELLACLAPVPPPKAWLEVTVKAPYIAVPYETYIYVYIDELYYAMPKKWFRYSCSAAEEWCDITLRFCLEVPKTRRLLFRYGYREAAYGVHVPIGECIAEKASALPPIHRVWIEQRKIVVVKPPWG
jgi:hypothetical protein